MEKYRNITKQDKIIFGIAGSALLGMVAFAATHILVYGRHEIFRPFGY